MTIGNTGLNRFAVASRPRVQCVSAVRFLHNVISLPEYAPPYAPGWADSRLSPISLILGLVTSRHVATMRSDRRRAPRQPRRCDAPGGPALGTVDRSLRLNPRLTRVVECRFFSGMSIEETASALGSSPATVKRDWALARAWLYRELNDCNLDDRHKE
jgi:hypothetical protein